MARILFNNAAYVATVSGRIARRGAAMSDLGLIENGAVLVEDGKILATGTTAALANAASPEQTIDCAGKTILPGFVDSHTHFIFAGYRAEEFALRLQGVPYMEIMSRGGGIAATTEPTRGATLDELVQLGRRRLAAMLEQGITTVEGKSGYGLDCETELRQLRAMAELAALQPVDIITTFMGAHAIPAEYQEDSEGYIRLLTGQVLPRVAEAGLAEFCDVFCEAGVFELAESERILRRAESLGFRLKLHADEIVGLGGAELAVRLRAISADHLLRISEQGIDDLASSETIATLLPLTAFSLKEPYAPARRMIDRGCAVALASDLNPGSCFSQSIPLIFALATIHMGMTVEEAIVALTLNGAAAVARADCIGSLEAGKQADMVILGCPDYRFLSYHFGMNLVETVVKGGRIVYRRQG